jgi:hypothetical protein
VGGAAGEAVDPLAGEPALDELRASSTMRIGRPDARRAVAQRLSPSTTTRWLGRGRVAGSPGSVAPIDLSSGGSPYPRCTRVGRMPSDRLASFATPVQGIVSLLVRAADRGPSERPGPRSRAARTYGVGPHALRQEAGRLSDRLVAEPAEPRRIRLVYVSPLNATRRLHALWSKCPALSVRPAQARGPGPRLAAGAASGYVAQAVRDSPSRGGT